MVDFGQLEAATAKQEAVLKEQRSEVKKEISEMAAKVAEKVVEKDSAGTRKADKTSEKTASTPSTKSSVKTYEFISADGTKVSVPADYKVVKKVDGKEVEATLADLADEFSGKTSWDKRFNEFSAKKKEFDAQFAFVNENVDKIMAKAQTEPMQAFYDICRLAGKSPQDVTKAMSKVGVESSKWLTMSEAEQKAFFLEMENNLYKASEADKKAAADRKAEEDRKSAEAEALRNQYGLSEDDWSQGSELAAKMFNGVRLEPVHIVQASRCQTVANVFERAYPEGLQNQEAFDEVFSVAMAHPEFDASDIEDIVKETFASASAKRLGRKVTSQTPEKTEAPRKSGQEAWSFDQV